VAREALPPGGDVAPRAPPPKRRPRSEAAEEEATGAALIAACAAARTDVALRLIRDARFAPEAALADDALCIALATGGSDWVRPT
jgi:hypothetical protein